MRELLKMFGVVSLLGALMMAGGCGGGNDAPPPPANPSSTVSFTATTNANGSATTPATVTNLAPPASTTGYLAEVSASIPPSTTITATNADGTTKVLTAAPTITFTVPLDATPTESGVNGVPVPVGSTAIAASGVVQISISGAASATFSNPITVTMPVPGEPAGEVISVYTVQEGSTTYNLVGNFTVAPAGFVSFPVTHLTLFTSGVLSLVNLPATTVTVGQLYSFVPIIKETATGNTLTGLTFSINKLPPGLSFNTSTGELRGIATTVGTTSGIVISFTGYRNGTKTLDPFNLTVSATGGTGGTGGTL